jgi:hypothetical protein
MICSYKEQQLLSLMVSCLALDANFGPAESLLGASVSLAVLD